MRQQLVNVAGGLSWKLLRHVAQVGMQVVPVRLGRLNGTPDDPSALPGQQRGWRIDQLLPRRW